MYKAKVRFIVDVDIIAEKPVDAYVKLNSVELALRNTLSTGNIMENQRGMVKRFATIDRVNTGSILREEIS